MPAEKLRCSHISVGMIEPAPASTATPKTWSRNRWSHSTSFALVSLRERPGIRSRHSVCRIGNSREKGTIGGGPRKEVGMPKRTSQDTIGRFLLINLQRQNPNCLGKLIGMVSSSAIQTSGGVASALWWWWAPRSVGKRPNAHWMSWEEMTSMGCGFLSAGDVRDELGAKMRWDVSGGMEVTFEWHGWEG